MATPRTSTFSRVQVSAIPRRTQPLHGTFWSHLTLRSEHEMQLLGARWVDRRSVLDTVVAGGDETEAEAEVEEEDWGSDGSVDCIIGSVALCAMVVPTGGFDCWGKNGENGEIRKGGGAES